MNRRQGSANRALRFTGASFIITVIPLAASPVLAANANDFAIFGRDSLTFEGFIDITGAPAASNGNVHHKAGVGNFPALFGGGTLLGEGNARQDVAGDVIFNGDVTINELSSVGGSVHSGGNLDFQGGGFATVGGSLIANGFVNVGSTVTVNDSIIAGGNVDLGPSAHVVKNVGSNGNVHLGISAKVDGHVTHGGTLTLDSFATVGSSSIGLVVPAPAPYTHVSLPAATSFTSGGADVTLDTLDNVTLAPGSYGDLIFNGSSTLTLSSGTYFFDSIDTASPTTSLLNLKLNLSGGPLRILVTGNVDLDVILPMHVNGLAMDLVDPTLAGGVLLESHGDLFLEGDFFGTLFAPRGTITTGTINHIIGSIVAQDAVIGSSTDVTFVPSTFLPEPASLSLLGMFAAGMLRRRR